MKMAWPRSKGAPFALILALGVSMAPNARAQTKEELDKARALFLEGLSLHAANNCAAALTKYREVAKVKMTAQVAFNIAECEERLGRLVQALGNYRVAAAQGEGDKKAKEVMAKVGDRIEAIEGRIPKLTITRAKGGDTAVIELDGTEIGVGQLGSPIPVDPGAHVIVAKVGNKELLHESVTLAEKENKTFEVKLTIKMPKIEQPKDEPPPDLPKEEPPPPPRSRTPGIVVTVIGGVVMIAGFSFLAPRAAAISELDKLCGGDTTCPPSAEDTANRGKLFTGLAEGFVVAGVVGLATGIALIATSGPRAPEKKSNEKNEKKEASFHGLYKPTLRFVGAAPGASLGGMSVMGRF